MRSGFLIVAERMIELDLWLCEIITTIIIIIKEQGFIQNEAMVLHLKR